MIEINGCPFVGPGLHLGTGRAALFTAGKGGMMGPGLGAGMGPGKCFIAKGITAGMAGAGKVALVPVALPLALPAAALGAGSVAAPIALAGAIAGGVYLLWRRRRPIKKLSEEDTELLDALAGC